MMSGGGFWHGIDAIWWIVAIVVIIAFLYPFLRAPNGAGSAQGESPQEVLRRRYAAGEISTSEYEERKAVLDRDVQSAKRGTSGS